MTATEKVEMMKRIKESYCTKDDSFVWYERNSGRSELCIYDVDTKRKMLSLRASDRTASAAIYPELTVHDFGGGGSYDPVNRIMEITGQTFMEAVDTFLSWEGVESYDHTPAPMRDKKEKEFVSPYLEKYLRTLVLNRHKYEVRYKLLAKDLFRSCTPEEQNHGEKLFLIGFIPVEDQTYEGAVDRIFIPEFDESGVAYGSYRYNRSCTDRKGLLRKDSKRVLFGSHLLQAGPVVFAEGHTDVVVNVSKGIQTVTTGSATKAFGDNISLLSGRVVHDFPDMDMSGLIGVLNRAQEIAVWNESNLFPEQNITHKIYMWGEGFHDSKLQKRFDSKEKLSNEVYFEFLNEIIDCVFTKDVIFKVLQKYASKKSIAIDLSTWKILGKGIKPGGYDWIDFHTENQDNPKYPAFINSLKAL
jgi:hypothetical protein